MYKQQPFSNWIKTMKPFKNKLLPLSIHIKWIRMENERIQKAAAEAIDLKTKYDKLHQQHHALNHEFKKKNEEITKLQ